MASASGPTISAERPRWRSSNVIAPSKKNARPAMAPHVMPPGSTKRRVTRSNGQLTDAGESGKIGQNVRPSRQYSRSHSFVAVLRAKRKKLARKLANHTRPRRRAANCDARCPARIASYNSTEPTEASTKMLGKEHHTARAPTGRRARRARGDVLPVTARARTTHVTDTSREYVLNSAA